MDRKHKQTTLLKTLCNTFNDNGLNAVIQKEKVEGHEFEILRVAYREYIGDGNETIAEYYFLETDITSPEALYFNGVITLKTNVGLEVYDKTVKIISLINSALPFGSYVLNIYHGVLMFKLESILYVDTDIEVLNKQLDLNAAHLLDMSEKYSETVLEAVEGDLTIEEFKEVLNIQ